MQFAAVLRGCLIGQFGSLLYGGSEITVESGGTAIIGGIFQTTERDDEVKVPLFGDIPLLGALFRHKSKLKDKTELLVFLTPTILNKP